MTETQRLPDGRNGADGAPAPFERVAELEACDQCGEYALAWVRCKLICRNCRQINKSCADL